MYACLFLIILGIVSVQGAQSENQQEKSMNLNAKRFYEPGMRLRGYFFSWPFFVVRNFSFNKSRRRGNQNQNVSLVVLGIESCKTNKRPTFHLYSTLCTFGWWVLCATPDESKCVAMWKFYLPWSPLSRAQTHSVLLPRVWMQYLTSSTDSIHYRYNLVSKILGSP